MEALTSTTATARSREAADAMVQRFVERHRARDRATSRAVILCRVLVVIAPILLWQILADAGVLTPYIFSNPIQVFDQLVTWIGDGTLISNAAYTLRNALTGYVLGLLLGLVLAVLFASRPRLGAVFIPFIAALNAIPRIAVAPILISIFGLGSGSNVTFVLIVVFAVNFFAIHSGLSEINKDFLLWVRSLGAGPVGVWRWVRTPAILVWILSGLRVNLGLALSASVVAEFVGGAHGIGYLVISSSNTFQAAGLYAAIVATILFAATIDALLRWAEKRASNWLGHA